MRKQFRCIQGWGVVLKTMGKKYFSWGAFTPRLPKSMPDDNNQSPYIAEKTRAAALRESASE